MQIGTAQATAPSEWSAEIVQWGKRSVEPGGQAALVVDVRPRPEAKRGVLAIRPVFALDDKPTRLFVKRALHLAALDRLALTLAPKVLYTAGLDQPMWAKVTNNSQEPTKGDLTLVAPQGWSVRPAKAPLSVAGRSQERRQFTVALPKTAKPGSKAQLRVALDGASAAEEVRVAAGVLCPPAKRSPTIDGKIESSEWAGASRVSGFVIHDTGKPAAKQTEAWLQYDASRIFIAFRLSEPDPRHIKCDIRARDGEVWTDDAVEIFIDANRDQSTYFQLVVNSAGVQFDGARPGGESWNRAWATAAIVGPESWSVEVAIPFAALGSTPTPGDAWGLNLCRDEQQRGESSCWSPTGGGFHRPSRFGKLVFGK